MTILVTGAAGFVGRKLIEKLADAFPNTPLIGISREATAALTPSSRYISINLARDDLAPLFKAHAISKIYHLAAHSSVGQAFSQAALTFEENLLSCLNLARALKTYAPEAHLIFASTSEVYGASFNHFNPIDEWAPTLPLNAYARSKLAGEYSFQDLLGAQNKLTILRLFNHFGQGQDERFVIANFAAQIRKIKAGQQKPVVYVGNLEAIRDFLPLEDVLEAYLCVAKTPVQGIYNISSQKGRSIHSVLEDLIMLSGQNIELIQDPARLRPSDIPIAVGKNQIFKQTFDWVPQKDWIEALKMLL